MKRSFSFGIEIVCPAGAPVKPVFLGIGGCRGYSLFGRRALFSNLAGGFSRCWVSEHPSRPGLMEREVPQNCGSASGAGPLSAKASLEGEGGPRAQGVLSQSVVREAPFSFEKFW